MWVNLVICTLDRVKRSCARIDRCFDTNLNIKVNKKAEKS